MFKLYPSIGKNAAVGAGTWSVNGGKEGGFEHKKDVSENCGKNA